jgi:hypothetical protein
MVTASEMQFGDAGTQHLGEPLYPDESWGDSARIPSDNRQHRQLARDALLVQEEPFSMRADSASRYPCRSLGAPIPLNMGYSY